MKTNILLFVFVMFLTACGTHSPSGKADVLQSRAEIGKETVTHKELISLPKPVGKITAAVYDFRDMTGQYRSSPSNNLSTVVTQGADSILIKALLDSNWFIPVERSSLQNVLTERKIKLAELPESEIENQTPVTSAEVIVQGAIVSYDSNTHSGGYGAGLLGIGAFQSYREDRITINLRLVDPDNGLILHSVNSSKRIFSREISANVFSYVDDDKILELEVGTTFNEPSHLIITEAIESALIHVIGEGVLRKTWAFKNNAALENPVFDRFLSQDKRGAFVDQYLAEVQVAEERNAFIDKVRVRVQRAREGVKKHWEDTADEREERKRSEARSRYLKQREERLAAIEEHQKIAERSDELNKVRNESGQAKVQAPVTLVSNTQALTIDTKVAQNAIANQANAILKAQAQIQIQATQQAHQAALYAQQLILQKQQGQTDRGESQTVNNTRENTNQ